MVLDALSAVEEEPELRAEDTQKFTLRGHGDVVAVADIGDNQLVVAHALTRERKVFEGGKTRYGLVFEDSFGFLVPDEDEEGEVVALEQWLDKKVWVRDDGDLFLAERVCGDKFGAPWNLSQAMRDHVICAAELRYNEGGHSSSRTIFFVGRALALRLECGRSWIGTKRAA